MTENTTSGQLLGLTARWTAGVRARESARADHLFEDPWAEVLTGEEGAEWLAQRPEDSTIPMAIRTRFFDDFLQDVSRRHAIRQVVLMAAGLDTRAFRLDWPDGTCLFELDQPEVLRYKEQALQAAGARPACQRRLIEADLTSPWQEKLLDGSFDPLLPSIWLLEGFLFYLPNPSITQVLDGVTGLAAPGSWVGFDIINSAMLTSTWTRPWVEMQASMGAPWIGTLDAPQEFLARRGWQATLTQAGASDANYGRWKLPVLPVMAPDLPHNWFVTAQKQPS
jgi:methyltransferase (TIGR00027 family)